MTFIICTSVGEASGPCELKRLFCSFTLGRCGSICWYEKHPSPYSHAQIPRWNGGFSGRAEAFTDWAGAKLRFCSVFFRMILPRHVGILMVAITRILMNQPPQYSIMECCYKGFEHCPSRCPILLLYTHFDGNFALFVWIETAPWNETHRASVVVKVYSSRGIQYTGNNNRHTTNKSLGNTFIWMFFLHPQNGISGNLS